MVVGGLNGANEFLVVKVQLIFFMAEDTELPPFVAAHNTEFHFYVQLNCNRIWQTHPLFFGILAYYRQQVDIDDPQ